MKTLALDPLFPTSYVDIIERSENIDPVHYGRTRNFIDGDVTYLSPYISRGAISTKQILQTVLKRGFRPAQVEKFIQELAWRDYWQQLWITKGNEINRDLKNSQNPVANTGIPKAIYKAHTGVEAIDRAIQHFYNTGYLHNHVRMYIASICCNMARSHWKHPAKWMYYHLLDADWASNALSWQWVAGTNSNKKYVANQDNINKYCYTQQKGTFLDIEYSAFSTMTIPEVLSEFSSLKLTTPLPNKSSVSIDPNLPTCIYNFYNLDPNWKKECSMNRILLLEPSVFESYPISRKGIDFALALAKNIDDIQVYVGEFSELVQEYHLGEIHYKEHPLNVNYIGVETPRDWLFDVKGYYPSFFAFWKQCKKQLDY